MEKWIRARYLPGTPLGKDGKRITASPENIGISRRAAREGMVLLKNEGGTLPLSEETKIALFGKGTFDYVKGGGGSGDVIVPYVRNIFDGLSEIIGADRIYEGTVSFYRDYLNSQYEEGWVPGLVREPEVPEDLLLDARAFTDTAVVSISRFSGESWDRKTGKTDVTAAEAMNGEVVKMSDMLFEKGDFYLSDAERKMLDKVSSVFEKTIVVLNVGGMVETACYKEDPRIDAVLMAFQGGMEGACAAAELLMGKDVPTGKLTDTYARELTDYPGTEHFYDSNEYVDYTEDIYVGYRFFETIPGMKEKVVYPFGYGLSYTSFSLSDQKVSFTDTEVTASTVVTNIGNSRGREVVQVYYTAPKGKLGKPAIELGGYIKTKMLSPGEKETVSVSFPISSMSSFDDLGKISRSAWVLEKGEYVFHIGTSVRDTVMCSDKLVIDQDTVTEQLSSKLTPVSLEKRMLSDGSYEALPTGPARDPYENGLTPMEFSLMYSTPEIRYVPGINNFGKDLTMSLQDVADGKLTLDEFISGLSVDDMTHLLGGQVNIGLANTFGYGNDPVHGIPNIMTADGPAGVRFRLETGVTTTAFPCATLLASTWDPEIVYEVGQAVSMEAKENNIMVWLAPGVNIHRNPLCGRNFEYYSEDPLIAGKQASALIRGVQSNGIAATPKHFALNNKETDRRRSDSRASERAIREIYLKQFEIIVKEAHPWSLMSSYNIINGQRSSESKDLLTGILREDWGFDGMVVTDWWTMGEHYKEVAAGNDMKMATGFPGRLKEAMDKGLLNIEDVKKAVKNVLTLILRVD